MRPAAGSLAGSAGQLANQLRARAGRDQHLVPVDHDHHVLQPDRGNARAVGLDQLQPLPVQLNKALPM